MELIGNSPEETAYHEAGHSVTAAAVGLDLRPAGILMFEVRNVAAGIACYWEDGEVEPVLQALRAGQMAQQRQFPNSETRGGVPDAQAFSKAVNQIYSPGHVGIMLEKIGGQVLDLFAKHWGAVDEVAQALLRKDWASVEVTDEKYLSADERSVVRRKKQLTGSEIVEILERHGISARVRSTDSDARAFGRNKFGYITRTVDTPWYPFARQSVCELGRAMKHKKGMVLAALLLVTASLAQDTPPTDSGVYYLSGRKYTPMKRACNSGMKAMSFGVRGKFVYPNPSGPIQIDEHRPMFVFVGADQAPSIRVTFALINMTAKKKNREAEFAAGGVMKNMIDTRTVHDASVFKVTPTSDIPAGEYLLGMYQGVNDPTIANLLGCGYDFSVK